MDVLGPRCSSDGADALRMFGWRRIRRHCRSADYNNATARCFALYQRMPRYLLQRSGAVVTNQPIIQSCGKPTTVLHQVTTRAGEFVGLNGQHTDGELLTGQVSARQLEWLGILVVVVDIKYGDRRIDPPAREVPERIGGLFVSFSLSRCVVIGIGHVHPSDSGMV
jgi:hypothetical protein